MKSIVIAGTHSGCGKTTVSLGIMAALTKNGKKVAPFKVGPDYIDPSFYKFVTGNPSNNLDSWLLDSDTVKYLFNNSIDNMDIGIVEGVMGMHDGFGIDKSNGSTAHIAKIIKSPVVLVVEAKAMSVSAAALVLGYMLYDKDVEVKGVIFNKVSGEKHYNMLKKVIERDLGIKCLGYLPKDESISLKSRHLGLIPAEEVEELRGKVDDLVELVEKYIDLDALEGIANVEDVETEENPAKKISMKYDGLKIGIAKDTAFSFYYHNNLKLIKEAGVQLIPFSPLNDGKIPDELDGLYIGGGFPEMFADKLHENISIRKNIKTSLEDGLPAYAECGGLMYLTEGIVDLQGQYHEMVGFFSTKSIMTNRLNRFGYVNVETTSGINIRAHEFHKSYIEDNDKLEYRYQVSKNRADSTEDWKCGLVKHNVIAGYPHIHFYSNLEFLKEFLNRCIGFKSKKKY